MNKLVEGKDFDKIFYATENNMKWRYFLKRKEVGTEIIAIQRLENKSKLEKKVYVGNY